MKENIKTPEERKEEKFYNKMFAAIFVIIIVVVGISYIADDYYNTGVVTGIFVDGYTIEGNATLNEWNSEYGHPSTAITLSNYSMNGVPPCQHENTFFFRSYYPDVEKMIAGHSYAVVYKKGVGLIGDPRANYKIKSVTEV